MSSYSHINMESTSKIDHINHQLTESEERFRSLVTATSDVIYHMSPDWSVMRQLKGGGFLLDVGEPITDWLEKYICLEEREKVKDAIGQAISTKSMFQLEHRVHRADGSIGWTLSHAVPIFNNLGEVVEWFGTANDITWRKESEEALNKARNDAEQQQRLYETITSSTPDLIYVFDLDYRFTYANEALLNMWGKSWDNAIGKKLIENGYEPWHAEMHEREIDQVVATKRLIRGEVSFPHASLGPRIYDYIFTPVINAGGEVEAVAGTTRDITEIKLSEMSLAESEARFRNMAEGTNIFIAMFDETGSAIYFNQTWRALTGKTMEELRQYNWIELIHPDDKERHMAIYQEALEAQAPLHNSFRLRTQEGIYRWLLIDASVRSYSDGSFAGYVAAAIDITELKEDEIRKNDFISMVSHELKTPLTSAQGYIQLLKKNASRNSDQFTQDMLSRTEKQIGKMTTMINGFLNVARLESGKIDINLQRFNMVELMKEIEEETTATVSSHRVFFASFEEIMVFADYDKIGQVVQNFISNAMKYSPLGSTIQVSCKKREGEVQVSVSDEGMGIKDEDLSRLFERFYRVNDVEKRRRIAGFGIGLYLCAEIVKRHGGKTWAESELGKGSTFYFTLPVY